MTNKKPNDSGLYEKHYPEGLNWDAKIEPAPVHTILADTAKRFGSHYGFNFMGKRFTWKTLRQKARALAKSLQDMGIHKDTRVGICLPNTPYYLIAYYAIAESGATIVNFNPLYADNEIRDQIQDSGTRIMITADLSMIYDKIEARFNDTELEKVIVCKFSDILPFPKNWLFPLLKFKDIAKINKSDQRISWFHKLVNHNHSPDSVNIDPLEDIALLQYTGGTTGTPKGAMLTHGNITSNLQQCSMWLRDTNEGKDKMIGVIPFFHVFAMTGVMNLSVGKGFEIIATPKFELKDTLKYIHKYRPQFFPAVPAIYSAINNFSNLDQYDLSSLKYCISGGAPLPIEVKKQFEEKTGCYLVEGYGLTETSPVVTINPPGGKNPKGSIGLPLPGTLVKITDREDPSKELGLNEPGELCVKGPQVMKSYWKRPEETKSTLIDGWLHTGDVAKVDEDGFVYIVDRMKDLIITNGYNVYPRHVEEAIYQNEDVEECIVAGVPDSRRGEKVKAWIKMKKGKSMNESDLKNFLKDKLSKIEQPREIEFRDGPLPKTMIGKLSRKDILEEEEAKSQSES